MVTTDVPRMDLPTGVDLSALEGRTMLCRKTKVVPIECVVRGYLSGSGWAEYRTSGTVCGIRLPAGLTESARLPEPIFTPATKAESGHDENISFPQMVDAVGREVSEELRRRSIDIFRRGAAYALERGIIIADTKFEFGQVDGQILLIDEVLTPDSSRFWPAEQYAPGRGQPSFDKQFVRDWLTASGWDKNSPPPALPDDVVAKTRAKYVEAYEQLTGQKFGECGDRKAGVSPACRFSEIVSKSGAVRFRNGEVILSSLRSGRRRPAHSTSGRIYLPPMQYRLLSPRM